MADDEQRYPRFDGVLMKEGVRVLCNDRDEVTFDMEGTITGVIRNGPNWTFQVDFDGPSGGPTGVSQQILASSVCPSDEERNSEEARQWRAERSLRVFLCHASEDKAAVRLLYARLKELGFRPWLDEIDLCPGVEWAPEIERAVRDSHAILVCLSAASTTKVGFVQKEIRFALDRALEMPEGAIFIIPVRLGDCVLPRHLSKWQAVDLFSNDGENRLVAALRAKAQSMSLLAGVDLHQG